MLIGQFKFQVRQQYARNGSNIAKHDAWSFDHRIGFDNSSVIDKGSFRTRKALEAWHTSATKFQPENVFIVF